MKKLDYWVLACSCGALIAVGVLATPAVVDWVRREFSQSVVGDTLSEASGRIAVGRYIEARALLGEVLKTDPDNIDVLINMGSVHVATGHYAAAEACFRRVSELRPQDRTIWARLGYIYGELGQDENAIDAWRKSVAAAPYRLMEPYREIGKAYVRLGDPEAALAALREGIDRRPADFREHYMNLLVSKLRELEGDEDRAGECADVRRMVEQGVSDETLARYEPALVLETFDKEQTSRLHFDVASILSSREESTLEAIAHYDEAIEMDPEYAEAYNNRAVMRYMAGQYDGALADLDRVETLGLQAPPGLREAIRSAAVGGTD